jgi:acetyl esterase/lipase
MLDFLNARYINPGQHVGKVVDSENEVLAEIDSAIQSGKAIDGYPFPSSLATDPRFKWAATMHQAARYIDVLTRSPGLTKKIAQEGVQIIPEEHRPLFPATFGLNKNFPPTVLLHGDADELVDFELSSSLAPKLESLGIDVHLERAVGQGHGFEAHEYIDLDSEDHVEDKDGRRRSLKRVVQALERYIMAN